MLLPKEENLVAAVLLHIFSIQDCEKHTHLRMNKNVEIVWLSCDMPQSVSVCPCKAVVCFHRRFSKTWLLRRHIPLQESSKTTASFWSKAKPTGEASKKQGEKYFSLRPSWIEFLEEGSSLLSHGRVFPVEVLLTITMEREKKKTCAMQSPSGRFFCTSTDEKTKACCSPPEILDLQIQFARVLPRWQLF